MLQVSGTAYDRLLIKTGIMIDIKFRIAILLFFYNCYVVD